MRKASKAIIPVTPASQPLVDISKSWDFLITAYFANRKPSTLRSYGKALKDFGVFFGNKNPLDFKETAAKLFSKPHGEANATVFAYRTHLQERKLANNTINVHLAAVKSLGDIARMMGLVSWKIEVESLKAVSYKDTSGPGKDAILLVIADLEKKTDPIGRRNLAVVRLIYTNGLRRKEVGGLDLAHVDFKKDKVWILGKGRSAEEGVTIGPKTKAAIEAWLTVRRPGPGPLFINFDPTKKGGERLSETSIYRIIHGYGLGHPHGIRHSAITEALDKTGGDVRAVQRFSRHKKLETLMIYDDNRKDLGGEVTKKLDEDT